MRLTSAFALGLLISAGSAAVMTGTPAFAAKEDKKATPKAEYSKSFIAAAGDLEKANKAKDYAALKTAVDKATPAASTPDDQFLINFYRYQLSVGTNDAALQKQAVEGMLASGKTSPDMVPTLRTIAGQFALQAGDAEGAIGHLEQAGAGLSPEARYLLAEAYFSKAVKLGNGRLTPEARPVFAQGLTSLQGAIDGAKAAGTPVPAGWYARGAEVGRVVGSDEAAKWALEGVKGNSSPKSWSVLLSAFQDGNRNLTRAENLDILRLKSATSSLMSPSEYAEYVDAASKSGLVGEVKSVIDKGRAAGVLNASNLSDYYSQASAGIASDKAALPGAETQAAKAANGKIAAATADAYLGYGDYAKAAQLYRLALQKGGVAADEVNTRLGIALARSGDMAGAKAAFGAVTSPGARKQIAEYWMTWIDGQSA